ncbi:MAG: NADH-quinone oxidoreductase subunit N [Actinomycetota bacterium]|nr:NADH-quinone oxidoreductase subunit N [Actinomycetota bacterium]
MVQSIDYHAVAPLLVVAGTALVVLVADLFLPPARRGLAVVLSLVGVAAALGATLSLLGGGSRGTFCTPPGRLSPLAGAVAVGQSCSYVVDGFSLLFDVLFLVTAAVVLLLSMSYLRDARLPPGEYCFLLLSALVGMLGLAASRDLIMLVVALEVVSLPGFVLAGLRRGDARSSESALKFFLISVLATAVMLLGMSLLYGLAGSVQLDRVAVALQQPALRQPVTAAAVLLVVVGFGFKVSAVPFHFWTPDTYDGAPLPVAAFLSVASKAAGFAGLLSVLLVGLRPYADVWGPLLAVLAAATMTLGNLLALQQRSVVRLLAWSSIAQAGYILVPLAAAASVHGRRVALPRATAASLGYLAIYAAMNLGAFGCVVAVARRRPQNDLADYRGLAAESPLLAIAFAFFLLCLAGVPPGLAGLFAKVVVFRTTVDGAVVWLGVVMALNTVIALAYYLRLAAGLFARADVGRTPGPVVVPLPTRAAIALTVVVTVVLSVDPQLVLHAADLATFDSG